VTTAENVIAILNIVICFPCVFVGCHYLRDVAALYEAQSKAFSLLAAFAKPADARKAGLPCFLDLVEGNNTDAWMLIRSDMVHSYAASPEQIRKVALLAPLVILDILLMIIIFVRVVILGIAFDIFNILSVYDMVVLDVFLVGIMLYVVRCNIHSSKTHRMVLERERYRIGKLIYQKPGFDTGLEKSHALISSAIGRVQKLRSPVKIIGIVIDQSRLVQLMGIMATGVASGLSKIIETAATA